MHCLVINLESAQDRWCVFQTINSRLMPEMRRVNAIDGAQVVDKWHYLSKWSRLTHEPGKHNIKTAIACFLSHRKCWQQIVTERLPYALVLEDDAVAKPELTGFIEAYEDNPPSFDIVRLHVHRNKPRLSRDQKIGQRVGDIDLTVNLGGAKSTAAYIITFEGAQKALNMRKLLAPVDHFEWLYATQGLVFVQSQVNLLETNSSFGSSISSNSGNMLLRLPSIARIGLVRCLLGRKIMRGNLKDARKLAHIHAMSKPHSPGVLQG